MTDKPTILAGSTAEQQIKSLATFYGFEEVLRTLRGLQLTHNLARLDRQLYEYADKESQS